MPAISTSADIVGLIAAFFTTLCWLPQAWHTIRTRDTSGLSLWTQLAFTAGIGLWLVYGLMIASLPVILANSVTLMLMLVITGLKLRYG